MPVYRQIHTNFWQDPYILNHKFEQKTFYLYLLTNSKTKQCGIYEISLQVIEFETGLEISRIEEMLAIFIKDGKIEIDRKTNEILIKNWTKNNYNASPKVQKCIEKELRLVKSDLLKENYNKIVLDYVNSISTLSKEEKEEEQKEIKEDEKELLLFNQTSDLFTLWNQESTDDDKLKCRKLIKTYSFSKVKDAFNKAADLGQKNCNLKKVEEILKEMKR